MLFVVLITSGSKAHVAASYALGALLMIETAIAQGFFGAEAAGKLLSQYQSRCNTIKTTLDHDHDD